MLTIVLFLALITIIGGLIPVRKLIESFLAQFRKVSRMVWQSDPVAIYQSRIEEAMEMLSQEKSALVEARGLLSGVERNCQTYQENVTRLDSRISIAMAENRETEAQELAEKLVLEKKKLVAPQKLLVEQQKNYGTQTARFKAAWERIETEKNKAGDLKIRLDLSKIEAQMNKINTEADIGGSFRSFDEVEQEIQRQIDANQATGIVDKDLGLTEEPDYGKGEIKSEVAELLDKYRTPKNAA